MDVKATTLNSAASASLASLVVTAVPSGSPMQGLASISGQLSIRRADAPAFAAGAVEVRLIEALTGLDEHLAHSLPEGRFALLNVPAASGHRLCLSLPPQLASRSGLPPCIELYLPLELLDAETTELLLIVGFVDRNGDGIADGVELDMRQSSAGLSAGSFWRSFRPEPGESAGAALPVGRLPQQGGWLSRRIPSAPRGQRTAFRQPRRELSPQPELFELPQTAPLTALSGVAAASA